MKVSCRTLTDWLLRLVLVLAVAVGRGPARPSLAVSAAERTQLTDGGLADPTSGLWARSGPVPGGSEGLLAAAAPAGWAVIERRVLRGVQRGVARFRLAPDDRDDAVGVAMERAWRAHAAAEQPILHPEAWARTIAARVCLDVVRRQQRERRWQLGPEEHGDHALEQLPSRRPDPLELAAAAERRELLHRRLATWPAPEQELAQVILDGEADSLTAAAWRVREREEARGTTGTMYPQKARVLLESRRGELRDLA